MGESPRVGYRWGAGASRCCQAVCPACTAVAPGRRRWGCSRSSWVSAIPVPTRARGSWTPSVYVCVCVQVRARARSCVCRSAYSISVCKGDVHASACTHARVRAHTHRDTLTQPSTLGSRPSAATAAASGQGTLSEGHGFGTHSQPVNVCECLSTYRVCPSSEHARQTWPL